MPSPILDTIPFEILVQVTSYLATPDYGSMRLTSRHFDASLFPSFARRYFSRMRFMRTEFSLQSLIDISQFRLSLYLKHVDIATETLHPGLVRHTDPMFNLGNRMANSGRVFEREAGYNKFQQMSADQVVFINTGQDQQMLIEAFRNLRLESVGIQYRWRRDDSLSCGSAKIRKETTVDLRTAVHLASGGYDSSNSVLHVNCFHVVLYALGKSGSRPTRLDTGRDNWLRSDEVFHIPRFLQQVVLPVLASLHTLIISIGGRSTTSRMRLVAPNDQAPYMIDAYHLRKFLASLTQLIHLHLCFTQKYGNRYDDFFNWFAAPVLVEEYIGPPGFEPPESPAFTQLRELELTGGEIFGEHLLAVFRKYCSTLRKLSLRSMTIRKVDKRKFSPQLSTALLCEFFADWSQVAGDLKEIHLSNLAYLRHHDHHFLFFKNGNDRRSNEFSYVGLDVRNELEGLCDKICRPLGRAVWTDDIPENGFDDWLKNKDEDNSSFSSEYLVQKCGVGYEE